MKTNLLRILAFAFALALAPNVFAENSLPQGDCPAVRVIVGEKKIWFIADETPVANLSVRVLDAAGAVALEKKLSSKNADWSLDVSALAEGQYRVQLGEVIVAQFRLSADKQMLHL